MEKDGIPTSSQGRLDFIPLVSPVTRTEVKAFRREHEPAGFWRGRGPYIFAGVIFGFIFIMLLFLAFLSYEGNGSFSLFGVAPIIAVLFAMILFTAQKLLYERSSNLLKIHRFASRNNLSFRFDKPAYNHNGLIFDEGESREFKEVLVFPDKIEVGNFKFVTGSGKNRSTHMWSFVKIKLPRRLPHMVLDAKQNNGFRTFSNLTDVFDKSQTLSLEGNFDQHFTLYAPKQYERDALYIFTPDVMAAIIDSGSAYDMEVIDDDLYLYRNGYFDLTLPGTYRSIFGVVDVIAKKLQGQSDYYADEKIGDRSLNIITPQGSRLKQGINWLAVAIFIGYIAFYVMEWFF